MNIREVRRQPVRVMNPPTKVRSRAVEALKRQLVRTQMPRIQMAVILLATGAASFLSSFVLLHIGLERMAIRYPLAVGLAYLVFILLLRVWLWYQQAKMEGRSDGGTDCFPLRCLLRAQLLCRVVLG